MIVAKFGGALLSDAVGLQNVTDRIARTDGPLVVVVSAFRGITNRLERIAFDGITDPQSARRELASIVAYHDDIATTVLGHGADVWRSGVAPVVTRLNEVIGGLEIVRELSGRTLDLIVSAGERLSSSLVTAALRQQGVAVEYLSALDLIITDNTHRFARPDLALTRERVDAKLRPLVQGVGVVVTEGYIARGTSGQATTMGRESSDYSATMLAELLGADRVHIYAGVPGIMTADPAVVPDARVIDRMSYSAAHVLAELGAKILHPRTVIPVERAGIPLVISSLDSSGTTIGPFGGDFPSVALMADGERVQLELETASVAVEPFVRAVGAIAPIVWHTRFRRRVQIVTAGPVDSERLPLTLLNEEPLSVERRSVAVVSVVREGGIERGFLTGLLGVLEGFTLLGVQGGVDSRAISFIVERMDAVDVTRDLHRWVMGGAHAS